MILLMILMCDIWVGISEHLILLAALLFFKLTHQLHMSDIIELREICFPNPHILFDLK
jgi:hypothetical protein